MKAIIYEHKIFCFHNFRAFITFCNFKRQEEKTFILKLKKRLKACQVAVIIQT